MQKNEAGILSITMYKHGLKGFSGGPRVNNIWGHSILLSSMNTFNHYIKNKTKQYDSNLDYNLQNVLEVISNVNGHLCHFL